ncbi:MAG: hypothetical protein JSR31_09010 [Nitrospira sp.]|nr:hypothetical protein [Nitrospira sp.]
MPRPQYYAQQEFLQHLARLTECECGHHMGRGKKPIAAKCAHSGKTQQWFLATRHKPRVPRVFTRLDAAVRLAQRLFKPSTMTVICRT